MTKGRSAYVRLEICTDNAAFDGPGCSSEVARILREAADKIERRPVYPFTLRDVNGNAVGEARLTLE